MARTTRGSHAVQATYADMAAARQAIATLERGGIPGSDITLEGPAAEHATRQRDQSGTDERFMRDAAKTVFGGAALGAAIGAVLGLIVGIVLLSGVAGALVAAAAGLAAGGAFGFILSPQARLQQSAAAELTYGPADGENPIVVVRTAGEKEAQKAEKLLADTAPRTLERVDSGPAHS